LTRKEDQLPITISGNTIPPHRREHRKISPYLEAWLGSQLYGLDGEKYCSVDCVSILLMRLSNTAKMAWQSTRYVTEDYKPAAMGNTDLRAKRSGFRDISLIGNLPPVTMVDAGRYFRTVKESFQIHDPLGKHSCLAFDPLS
jgi:hypothetical protein